MSGTTGCHPARSTATSEGGVITTTLRLLGRFDRLV
jgi:hypothetical protein